MTPATGKQPAASLHPSLIVNPISIAGIILAASSFFAIACLIAIDLTRGLGNPYMGILTYIVAPAFLTTGLMLTVVGALWERHRRRKLRPDSIPMLPVLDLGVARQRRGFIAVSTVAMLFLLLTAVGSYRTYEFTESVAFCGQTCHSVMLPEYTAYQVSPHARVACVQCHIGPGATWFVKSKLSGAYQVYATLADTYPRPIPGPIENLRPARETCEQCHWPEEFFGAVERTFHHYLSDDQNSPWTIQMLLKVGGGYPSTGAGIHWHMMIADKVEYIATDKERQVIPWVRLTDKQGNVTVFQSSDDPLSADQIAAAEPRVLDCIDCHNRAAHDFDPPVVSADLALQGGRIDRTIPDVKEQVVEALTSEFDSKKDSDDGISKALTSYYQSHHPQFASANASLITTAVAETQRIYKQTFFPDMKVDWRVYPDNVGHLNSPGCYRCHDGKHTSGDGKTITHSCNACHTIIAQGAPGSLDTSVTGLAFKHPVDIAGMWQQTKCSECHDGS
ncbi:MAG: NapC/NirT family cytochrome c [Acidobacteriota bacterium]|jgi:hypothetical protein